MIGKEALSTLKIAIVLLFFAATVWFALIGLTMSRDASNGASDEIERALEHNTEYVLNYLAAGKQTMPVSEAYALYSYNEDIISKCQCNICHKTVGALEDCCLKNHLAGKCKMQLTSDGQGGYIMIIDPAS